MRIPLRLTFVALALLAMSISSSAATSVQIQSPNSSPIQVEATFSGKRKEISGIQLRIRNTSTASVTIQWDACSLVLPNGRTERIVRAGILYITSALPQATTTIPPGGFIEESVWPATMTRYTRKRWDQDAIVVPTIASTLGLFLTWNDSSGRGEGMWLWSIQREPYNFTWLYVLGALFILGSLSEGLGTNY